MGSYALFFPLHYLGLMGVPRRYHEMGDTMFIPESIGSVNAFVTIMTLIVGAAQLLFFYNLIWSYFKGEESGPNPWRAASLEWQTSETPPGHGNFGKNLPIVYRWAYDYSVPGAKEDFIPQKHAAIRGVGQKEKARAPPASESRTTWAFSKS